MNTTQHILAVVDVYNSKDSDNHRFNSAGALSIYYPKPCGAELKGDVNTVEIGVSEGDYGVATVKVKVDDLLFAVENIVKQREHEKNMRLKEIR